MLKLTILPILRHTKFLFVFYSLYHIHSFFCFFFFNDTATTEIYTLSLHDALPICHLSWTSIIILLSAMIVPSTPGKMLIAALVSASMGPFGVWLAHLRGVDTPSVQIGRAHV